jgi:hypothetical protein
MANSIIYNTAEFYEQSLTCSHCGWIGTGADTIIIDMYGVGEVQQVNCPDCDNNLGGLPKVSPAAHSSLDDELGEQIG